jgi:hypothetical protein
MELAPPGLTREPEVSFGIEPGTVLYTAIPFHSCRVVRTQPKGKP